MPADLTIRPICPQDARRITDAVAYTSPETYYRRFHGPKPGFTDRELRYLTDIDGDRHVALVAVDEDRGGRLAAVARYVGDGEKAELAMTVHDPYQGAGLGRTMLVALLARAKRSGVRTLTATVQADNRRMVGLLHAVCGRDALTRTAYGPQVDFRVSVDDVTLPPQS